MYVQVHHGEMGVGKWGNRIGVELSGKVDRGHTGEQEEVWLV